MSGKALLAAVERQFVLTVSYIYVQHCFGCIGVHLFYTGRRTDRGHVAKFL
jgi:hypothetical protein